MRPLTSSDDEDHEQEWLPGGAQPAVDAFFEFIARHRGADNTSFGIEDEESADLLTLVEHAGTPLTDGPLPAATGVFTFSGPCAMSDGLVSHLRATGVGIEDTGLDRLPAGFLAPEDFTPAAVAGAAGWWSAEDVARGFAATAVPEREQPAPLDPGAVDRFCRIWADSGYNDRWDVHYVLFDSRTVEEAGEDRDEALRLVEALGLDRVDAPPGAATGEVWVRTDPRIDAELGNWP